MNKNLRTYRFGELTFTEAADAAKLSPIVLIPSGAIEQHGPHLPLNVDAASAEWIAEEIAKRSPSPILVAPLAPYGHSPSQTGYPGINLSFSTLQATITDIIDSLVAHGFKRLIFVNNNNGNQGPIAQAAWEARKKYGIVIGTIYPWAIGYEVMTDLYEEPARVMGHAAEPEHSAMLAMFPELVQSHLVQSSGIHEFEGWQPAGNCEAVIPGTSLTGSVFWGFSEVNATGVSGDPTVGTPELGHQWVDRVLHFSLAFIAEYDRNTAATEWAKA